VQDRSLALVPLCHLGARKTRDVATAEHVPEWRALRGLRRDLLGVHPGGVFHVEVVGLVCVHRVFRTAVAPTQFGGPGMAWIEQ
jgi:hypothetical protein